MNIDQIRSEITNYGNKIFLNSAGSSLSPKTVSETIKQYLDLEEQIGGYKATEAMTGEIEDFYNETALLLGCKPHNIAFTSNATDSYLKALLSFNFQKNDVIITSDDDYASNHIHFISLKNQFGIKIVRIANLDNGDLDIPDFQRLVDKHQPKLVAISHVPTNSGLVQNIIPIGEICHNENIPFLLDACQSAGQLVLDVKELKCDFLTATGRKFLRGPRGTGFLYVSDRMLQSNTFPLTIDGRGAIWNKEQDYELIESAKRFETWEKPYALQMGFTEAIRYANQVGLGVIQDYNSQLMIQFRNNLSTIKGIKMYDKGSQQCNILTFRKNGKSLKEIKSILDANHIFYSVSEREWGLIDFNKKGVDWAIRLSPHYFNTPTEIDNVSKVIDSI